MNDNDKNRIDGNAHEHASNQAGQHEGSHADNHFNDLPLRKQKLFDKAKHVSLTHAEKVEGVLLLKDLMSAKPTGSPTGIKPTTSMRTPYLKELEIFFASASISLRKKVLVPVAAILIFTLTAGTTFAASESLPGDVLYPVKINVNENIETFFAVSTEAHAKVKAAHAANRLAEAEKLAAAGRLDHKTETYLTEKFTTDADQVESDLNVMKEQGNELAVAEVSSDFESSLNSHHTVVANLSARHAGSDDTTDASSSVYANDSMYESSNGTSGRSNKSLDEIKEAIRGHIIANMSGRTDAEAAVMAKYNSDGNAKRHAEDQFTESTNSINNAENYIANYAASVGSTSAAMVKARLDVAKSVLIEGQAKIDIGSYAEADLLFKSAGRVADEARKTLKSTAGSASTRFVRLRGNAKVTETAYMKRGTSSSATVNATEGSQAGADQKAEGTVEAKKADDGGRGKAIGKNKSALASSTINSSATVNTNIIPAAVLPPVSSPVAPSTIVPASPVSVPTL